MKEVKKLGYFSKFPERGFWCKGDTLTTAAFKNVISDMKHVDSDYCDYM